MGVLAGKSALITGAASGIGRAVALLFASEGAGVTLADRDSEAGQAAARAIIKRGERAVFSLCEVSQAADCQRVVREANEAFEGLDIVVNAAGIIVRRSVVDLDEPDWDRVMAVNAKSVYLIGKYAIPLMQQAGGGSIVNISSGWGLVGGPDAAVYCASKGAVVQLTRSMAIDFGPQAVRVNCLCPGDTDTRMLKEEARQLGTSTAKFLKDAGHRPLGRIGAPGEIAQAALFLASDASSFMTGSVMVVDGGGLAGG
jgi:NAD(P)-dependent dehydrogenase (short-subunit alcohol dehydrogenase family)